MILGSVTLASNYRPGSGSILVKGLGPVLSQMDAIPNQVTLYHAGTMGGGTTYLITSIGGSTIQFSTVESGTDQAYQTGDLVGLQLNPALISGGGGGNGTGTVTQIVAGTGLSGGTITNTGTIAVANSTNSSLAGFASNGQFTTITVGANLALNTNGTLSSTASGNGNVNTGVANQLGVYNTNGNTISGTNVGLVLTQSISPTTVDTDGSTVTFNLALSNRHTVTLQGNRTLALSNPTVDQTFTIVLVQDGSGSRTVTWFSGITWQGGSVPTLQTTPGAVDVFVFWCQSNGVYIGFATAPVLAGTSGQLLYNNAGVLAGAANALISSNNVLNVGAAVSDPATPVSGDLWPSANGSGLKYARAATQYGTVQSAIFSCLSCNSVTNTTALTSVFGSPTNSKGSLTVPANTLQPGNIIRWQLTGSWQCSNSSPTLLVQVIFNTSVILQTSVAVAMNTSQPNASQVYQQYCAYTCLATGANGIGQGAANLAFVNPTAATLAATCVPGGGSPTLNSTFASTTNGLFDIKVQWSANSTANIFQITSFKLYID